MKERKPCSRSDALKPLLGYSGLIASSSADFDPVPGAGWVQTMSCNVYLCGPAAVEAAASLVWLLHSHGELGYLS